MKHSTFRKSSLISSVALLLVAIVALSGATFAWFSTKTTAEAGTIEMTAQSASGLYIVNDDTLASVDAPATGWSSKITWSDDAAGMPAVSGDPATDAFFKTSTDNADGTWNGIDSISPADVNKDYIVKKIWVKADTTDEVTLQIDPTVVAGENGAMKGYERIAIVTPAGTTVMDNAGNTVEAFIDQNGATKEVASSVFAPVKYTGTLDEPQAFYVYMWFEGQDADCYNLNAGANFKLDLGFALV